MRRLVDILIGVMIVLVLGGTLWSQGQQRLRIEQVAAVQEAMLAIQSQSLLQAAMQNTDSTAIGWSTEVSPEWFEYVPVNLLVEGGGSPWLEQAGEDQRELFDPPCIAADRQHAGFWYNPYRGVVRARVPLGLSHTATVELYNLVNGTSLSVSNVDWSAAEKPGESQVVVTGAGQRTTQLRQRGKEAGEQGGDRVLKDFGSRGRR